LILDKKKHRKHVEKTVEERALNTNPYTIF